MPYDIRSDYSNNILYIILKGFNTDEEAKQGADKVCEEVKKLKSGFNVINDISEFVPASPKAVEEIKRAQEFIKSRNVNRVIRIVNQSYIGSMQMSRASKEIGYNADTALSIEEAEQILHKK